MKGDARADDRLRLFRSEWPRRVSWAEVRREFPLAFRSAAQGALLLIPAIAATLVSASFFVSLPTTIVLPAWLEWSRGLLMIVALFITVGLWIWAIVLLSLPHDARREIAIRRFAQARGLQYRRYGLSPERQGILLAGGGAAPVPMRNRHVGAADATPLLYRASFAISAPIVERWPALQIATLSYSGSKSDPKGPRHSFRYMEMTMPRRLPHLMIDARRNGSLRQVLPGSQRLSFEGDFDKHFSVYVPATYERDALELLTPDVMACLIDYGRDWDIEVVDEKLIVASRRFRGVSDRAEYTAMLRFSELIGDELRHQAHTYTDPRAEHPRSQVASAGARLRLRSATWMICGFAVAVAGMLTFPHLLGWLLDR